MSTLAELQQKYPGAKYEAEPHCHKCNGTGEWEFRGQMVGCMCIYVNHENLPLARKIVGDIGRRGLEELRREQEHDQANRNT